MILAPTPGEREQWYAMLLLAQGLTAAAMAEALERDPHTIGRWASAFGEGGPAALILERPEVPPCHVGYRIGQLVLEGGSAVCFGVLRGQFEPPQLSDPVSSTG